MAKKKFRDPRGVHVRLYWSILDSPAWRALSFSQRALYVSCRRRLTSNNNGNLHFTLANLRDDGFTSSSTLAGGLRALIAVGLIAVTREGGRVARGQTIPVLYRFTDEDSHEWAKLEIPSYRATNEWQRFQTVEQVSAAIAKAEDVSKASHAKRFPNGRAATISAKKNSSNRKSNGNTSKSEHATIRNSNEHAISSFENRTDASANVIALNRTA
jgi:hypothetical protein